MGSAQPPVFAPKIEIVWWEVVRYYTEQRDATKPSCLWPTLKPSASHQPMETKCVSHTHSDTLYIVMWILCVNN